MTLSAHPELGREVPVAAIDKELRKLWEADEAHTNASLINLVVCSEAEGSLVENSASIRELTREHACRAILVEFDRDVVEPSIRAWITAHCHLSEGKKSVCCEQIAFLFTGRVTGRFRNTVFAHLNSDLPLVFWWQGELTSVFSERLSSVINRLTVDSSSWQDLKTSFVRLNEAITSSNSQLIVQDLAWTRTWQFRLGVAALFDDAVVQAALPAIQNVEIVHHPAHRSSALQMLAWLATQAGWRSERELGLKVANQHHGRMSFAFESAAGTPIQATLVADPDSAPLGAITIQAGDVVARVSRCAGATQVCRETTVGGVTHRSHSPADPDDAASLVGSQLSRGGKNTLYRKILPVFMQLLS